MLLSTRTFSISQIAFPSGRSFFGAPSLKKSLLNYIFYKQQVVDILTWENDKIRTTRFLLQRFCSMTHYYFVLCLLECDDQTYRWKPIVSIQSYILFKSWLSSRRVAVVDEDTPKISSLDSVATESDLRHSHQKFGGSSGGSGGGDGGGGRLHETLVGVFGVRRRSRQQEHGGDDGGYTYNTPTNVFLNYMDVRRALRRRLKISSFRVERARALWLGFNNGNCDEVFLSNSCNLLVKFFQKTSILLHIMWFTGSGSSPRHDFDHASIYCCANKDSGNMR